MADLVPCYNCHLNPHYECGFPMFGCLLCRTYGNGYGQLQKAYQNKVVEIQSDNKNYRFQPPNYSCLTCKDTKKMTIQIIDPTLVDNACSDPYHNMPMRIVSCASCCNEQFKLDRQLAEDSYFANKKN